jgi:hypothetical protein
VPVFSVVFVMVGRDDEKNEIQQEADQLHPFSAVQFIVDEERWNNLVCIYQTHKSSDLHAR